MLVVECDGEEHQVARLRDGRMVPLHHSHAMFSADTTARRLAGMKLSGCAGAIHASHGKSYGIHHQPLYWAGPRAAMYERLAEAKKAQPEWLRPTALKADPLTGPFRERAKACVLADIVAAVASATKLNKFVKADNISLTWGTRAACDVSKRRGDVSLDLRLNPARWLRLKNKGLAVVAGTLVIDAYRLPDGGMRVLALKPARTPVVCIGTVKRAAVSRRERIAWDKAPDLYAWSADVARAEGAL